jgi:hypoxanthine phosphoribosyltransferase
LSEHVATLSSVVPEIPVFQAYRGSEPPRFAHQAEVEYAKILDYHGIPWLYEPRTFVLEEDEDGKVIEAFTPDFYLPDQDLFVELTVMKQSLVTRKNRIKLFYKRDLERLAQRYGLKLAS